MQIYIQQNLDRDLSLEELARKSYFSEYHFHRIFRAVVGESLKEHIRQLRLDMRRVPPERLKTILRHPVRKRSTD